MREEFFSGFALAIVVGVPLGILMGWYSRVNAMLEPFVSALYATPRIALLPLVVIWFGIGIASKVAIVFLGAIFPILVNTITGVRTIEADFIKVARSFGASDRQMFLTVVLPSAVPMLLTGLRLGLGHALVGIVVGEMYGATAGPRLPDRGRRRALPDRPRDGRHHPDRRARRRAHRAVARDRAALRALAADPARLSSAILSVRRAGKAAKRRAHVAGHTTNGAQLRVRTYMYASKWRQFAI